MKLRAIPALAVAMVVGAPFSWTLPASAKTISVAQLERYAKDQKACAGAAKSKRVVTKAIRSECLGQAVVVSWPCPHGPSVATFPVGGSTYYLMFAGKRPEKIPGNGSPGENQLAYLCTHHTLVGAPPS